MTAIQYKYETKILQNRTGVINLLLLSIVGITDAFICVKAALGLETLKLVDIQVILNPVFRKCFHCADNRETCQKSL